jgi:ribosome-interacting GTPase 1
MPTNLPPEYSEAEERYRQATTPKERIARLEELISTVPKHKGTDKLRADLRKRLSKLRRSTQTQKKVSRHESAFHIDKEGAGQVAIIGPANVGKSALVTALTNANPVIAEYPYSTTAPMPGMMLVNDVQIQLVDTPPLEKEYIEPELLDLIRRSDIVLLVVNLQTYPVEQLEETIALLKEHRIAPCRLRDRYSEKDRMMFKPLMVVANKSDDEESDELFEIVCELLDEDWSCLPVSAMTGNNLSRLKRILFEELGIVRVYSKPPGEEPDLEQPFVLKKGSTIEEMAGKVHRDFIKGLKTARVWGTGVYDGQLVGRDHVLHDGDVVELRA